MRTLHSYLTRQVLLTLFMTVTVFTFVLLLTNLLKEILTLLVNHQATPLIVAQAIGLLVPFVLAFALPMGMLTAALLVFGRFSADQELTAARASGLSLVSLITPVLLLSIAVSLICGLFNLEIAPECRVSYKKLLYGAGMENTVAFVQEDRFLDFPGWSLYVRQRDGTHLKDVHLYKVDAGKITTSITASDGLWTADLAARTLTITLTNATFLVSNQAETDKPATDTPALEPGRSNQPANPEKTETRQWRPGFTSEWVTDPPIQLGSEEGAVRKPKLSEMSFRQLRAEIRERERQGIDTTPAQVQLHRQVAFSFASLGFTLIGIPLGIRAHRRETTAGVAMALLLVLVYYSFIVLAQSWEARTDLVPQLIVWIPNFLFQATGAVLLWRANHGMQG